MRLAPFYKPIISVAKTANKTTPVIARQSVSTMQMVCLSLKFIIAALDISRVLFR